MGSPADNQSWLHSDDNEDLRTCERTQDLVDHQVFDDMPERMNMRETNLGSSSSSFPWKFGSQAQGWMLLIFGSVSFILFAYAAGLSKLLPASGNPIIAAIQNDRYYCFLVPLTLPVLVVAVYFHWLSMKLFKHA